ncbi:hypothetical protein [Methyloglobulus sp.]|uniref:hypothetical protein n=1 Tax=Methyloglobulus sp. TaxID=2518622 RepID=UPI0032B876A7
MQELPYEKISAVYIIWFGLIMSAIVITLFQCHKKNFVDELIYRKHCCFWISLTMFWYLIGTAYLTTIAFINYDDDFFQWLGHDFVQSYLWVFLAPVLILLAVSLLPAKLQNWRSKAIRHKPQ